MHRTRVGSPTGGNSVPGGGELGSATPARGGRRRPAAAALVRQGLLITVCLSLIYSLKTLHWKALQLQQERLIRLEHTEPLRARAGARLPGGKAQPSTGGHHAERAQWEGAVGLQGEPPPDPYPLRNSLLESWPAGKPKAVIVVLARNREVEGVLSSMRQLEQRFNAQAGYPYVFLNDKPFEPAFWKAAANATHNPCLFGQVPKEHWSYPKHIDQAKAAATRKRMQNLVPYGGSESYRFMCRYFSGFFFRHPLLDGFDFYWRMEPGVKFWCILRQDPFRYMQERNISYGWNIIVPEVSATIPGLWRTVWEWSAQHPSYVPANNSLAGLVAGREQYQYYSGCHWWSNFEIGRLAFFRSKAYLDFFEHLDLTGGFFYERWGDAPVHSLAAALLLPRSQVHRFNDIGYQHNDWLHCPQEPEYREVCDCDPAKDVNLDQSFCLQMLRSQVGIY